MSILQSILEIIVQLYFIDYVDFRLDNHGFSRSIIKLSNLAARTLLFDEDLRFSLLRNDPIHITLRLEVVTYYNYSIVVGW